MLVIFVSFEKNAPGHRQLYTRSARVPFLISLTMFRCNFPLIIHADFIVLRKWRDTLYIRRAASWFLLLLCVDSSTNPRWGEDRRRPYKKEENSRRVG